MDFQTKRNSRKQAKKYFVIAYSMLPLFVLAFVILMLTYDNPLSVTLAGISMLLIVITSLIFAFIGQTKLNVRLKYKAAINDFRQHRVFNMIFIYIEDGKLNEAISLYSNYMKFPYYIDNLYGYLLHAMKVSTDPVLNQRAGEIIHELLEIDCTF